MPDMVAELSAIAVNGTRNGATMMMGGFGGAGHGFCVSLQVIEIGREHMMVGGMTEASPSTECSA